MSERNTLVRVLHDVGGAAWFGGSLMGAVALNGASADITDPTERAKVAAAGWARWAPVNAVAIAAHLAGGIGLLLANRGRVAHQAGVADNTLVKTVLTGAAVATTAYSGVLGAKVGKAGRFSSDGGSTPNEATPDDVASAQRQLRILQWLTPLLTAGMIGLGAQQGEQQRGSQIVSGIARKLGR